jgi:hypothetical protein
VKLISLYIITPTQFILALALEISLFLPVRLNYFALINLSLLNSEDLTYIYMTVEASSGCKGKSSSFLNKALNSK